ncbi:PHP domain-containing protein [uncultured Desulfovibrio sp.]|uniref:PHP domain-containing protein n=1 Tax=uncultured Desulfovibrio sp. TaxID=167968 RepID=UPI00260DE289|nr:PHP domain-containing protein [uncultured Desulfovibrio sp.]
MQFIDLHTHSQASDGTDSPAQLVRNAHEKGLAAVAMTDHDTVSGLDEGEATARELGLEFVRGCELSTSTELGEMHVLGLWLPRQLDPLLEKLVYLRGKRSERNVRIVEKLQGLGVEITLDEVLRLARGESVGRPHIAAVLVRKGYVHDVSEAFREYLGYYGRAYLPKEVLRPEEAVSVLSSLGATVCLAHPLLQKLPEGWLEAFIERLLPCGLTAIEAYHSEHTQADSRRCLELARHYGLTISGGSDYHGTNKPRIRLGTGYGSLRVPYSVLEGLREMRARRGLPC